MIVCKSFNDKIISIIQAGGIGIIPTDTVYGLVGIALDKKVVEKIYRIKGRDDHKPLIILISNISEIKKFKINLELNQNKFIKNHWPGRVSIILPSKNKYFDYLSRGTNSLTFRLPNNDNLINLLQKTGPLVAPSANPQGYTTAVTINEAQDYFGEKLDFYIDNGEIKSNPSTLVNLVNEKLIILREGDIRIK